MVDKLFYLHTWDEWDNLIHNHNGTCINCDIDIAECPCFTFQMVDMDGLQTVEKDGREWVVIQDSLDQNETANFTQSVLETKYGHRLEASDEYCDCCGCIPCDCNWGIE